MKLIDSVKNKVIKRSITASPNPFLENLNLNWQVEDGVSLKSVAVFTITGDKVQEVKLGSTDSSISLPFQYLPIGMYILYITFSDNRKESIKVIKK